MIRFECDYAEGMHPAILDALIKTNEEQTPGYGVDTHCEHARELIKKACHREDVDVHFLVGGTQTNATIIAAGLRPYQGVLSAVTGHINVHETGAIESYGHKVLPLPSEDGKITAAQTAKQGGTHSRWQFRAYGTAGYGIHLPAYREWYLIFQKRASGDQRRMPQGRVIPVR